MKHTSINITISDGSQVRAAAPTIVSASRATDIPAFYADWFFHRLQDGYVRWRNPFNNADSYVSFAQTHFIVFWSKNPEPLLPYLPQLKERGIGFYVQFTLNDYEHEGLEPHIPALLHRIDTFKRIVDTYGIGHAVWRFDPLILTDTTTEDVLLERILKIATELRDYTDRFVFSFADIATYRKVGRNLEAAGVKYREWTPEQMEVFAKRLANLNLRLRLATCSEKIDLEQYGIVHNHCIDPNLIAQLSPDDTALRMWLWGTTRDKGQRTHCGCILSKDIGAYNTCPHGCQYCYANSSPSQAKSNYQKIKTNTISESLIP